MTAKRIHATVVVGLLALASCAKPAAHPPVYPVHGQVLLEGKPVPHAFVVFHAAGSDGSEGVRPHAQADAEGTFTLTTYEREDGAPPGDYVVTVLRYRAPTESDNGPSLNLLPTRYASPKDSTLKARVDAGTNEIPPLQLKR